MSSSQSGPCTPGTQCRCSPCYCVECGDVVGVYEPLIAVLGDEVRHASLITVDRAGAFAHAVAYHEACHHAAATAG